MSVNIFLSIFKNHPINFVQIVRIVIRVQKFWCFIICGTYFLCQWNFIHLIFNDGVVFLLPVNWFPWYGAVPVVLSMPNIRKLTFEVSQDLTFLWRISGAVDETVFWVSRLAIYMPFSAIARALTLIRAIPRRGGFSSLLIDVTSTFGVCPGRFLIIRFYYTFVKKTRRFSYAQTY